ncbi:uncharacterized protein F4807DRAFT_426149 [Annulohypoxylon truncatum]|uniref:uncharacterized protein n=1 Tax=Annulohypoxylon truncatum TaxID=327061 RepID=UPI0020081471|nr:uncharacterized protein F4807DRAFT_426149 [Annulohypoxylon truncatum]KAI1209730.1 hypothetical protein F4807DRAFT_426149 [Annulohypoxylon truncatum]
MDQPTEQIQSELENFRQQWRAEVSARSKNTTGSQQPQQQQRISSTQAGPSTPSKPLRKSEPAHRKTTSRIVSHVEDEEEYIQTQSFDEPDPSKAPGQKLGRQDGPSTTTKDKEKEPQTALDFYEKAVEKETSGKLGDSLQLYRKAFRMDDNVDQSYRNKHFPARWTKPVQVNPSNAPATVPNTAHHSLEGPTLSLPDLIASFSDLRIEGVPPECEGVEPPPCPMAALPDEILVHILRDVAVADVGDFVRLAQVCKRLAYLVATEDQIWRRVCLGTEFGFGGMHFHWQLGITWEPLSPAQQLLSDDADADAGADVFTLDQLARQREEERRATTSVLLNSLYAGSWATMFRRRPRVRFNGCYISTVNYIRAGQASVHQITWNSPVHIVTYYRYLRLFRDGSAISLLTTDEPAHVVHHMTKDNLALHRGGAGPHLPSAVMANALKGRWRLSSEADDPEAAVKDMEGDLFVETEGVGPKYMYRMELTFKGTGAGKAKVGSNKVSWKGFWSYNRETDDWAEFALRHYKPFFFSRVRSYGVGEV